MANIIDLITELNALRNDLDGALREDLDAALRRIQLTFCDSDGCGHPEHVTIMKLPKKVPKYLHGGELPKAKVLKIGAYIDSKSCSKSKEA